jgi:hypothetical protein
MRLFRLVRAAKVLIQFRDLWLLTQGLFNSVKPMLWVALILFLLIYCSAIVGMELMAVLGQDNPALQDLAHDHFPNMLQSFLTLVQFTFLDSIHTIYKPIIHESMWMGAFFAVFTLMSSVSLMNLVTAIMVENASQSAREDREAQKLWTRIRRRELMPKLRALFHELDVDGSGQLSRNEIKRAPRIIKDEIKSICPIGELEELFEILDYDGSGMLDADEFSEGIFKFSAEKNPEMVRLMKQVHDIQSLTHQMHESIKREARRSRHSWQCSTASGGDRWECGSRQAGASRQVIMNPCCSVDSGQPVISC